MLDILHKCMEHTSALLLLVLPCAEKIKGSTSLIDFCKLSNCFWSFKICELDWFWCNSICFFIWVFSSKICELDLLWCVVMLTGTNLLDMGRGGLKANGHFPEWIHNHPRQNHPPKITPPKSPLQNHPWSWITPAHNHPYPKSPQKISPLPTITPTRNHPWPQSPLATITPRPKSPLPEITPRPKSPLRLKSPLSDHI